MWWFLFGLIWGLVWGFATNAVIRNKGYKENWFWWGFFFGLIALIVAATKPSYYDYMQSQNAISKVTEENINRHTLSNGGWECPCGAVNPAYTGTCSCGRTKAEVLRLQKQTQEEAQSKAAQQEETENLDRLKKLKELLDIGAITNEEFEQKKRQLLDI